jgi:thiamine-monophosphate kinase
MLISKLGEFGLIARIKKLIQTDSSVIKGIGDDCAVIKFDRNRYLLLTTDMIVEGVDFTRHDDPYLVGRKALAISLSDIAACAGMPRYALMSLGMPKNTRLNYLDRLLKGALRLAKEYKLNLVGGDISRAGRLTINTSIAGIVEKKYLVLRNGARAGDIIFVTGRLGGANLGKHLKFRPRIKEARFLVKNFKINAMIDISDGLAQDLGHILKESNTGAIIFEELIPLAKEALNLGDALYAGEDFELIFTVSGKEARRIISSKMQANFTPIGEITDKKHKLTLMDKKGKAKIIASRGFRHF